VPEANLPVICTGQRCQSGDEQFVVLGYSEVGDEKDLSMIPLQGTQVQGLLLNHSSGTQEQKTFELHTVYAIENSGDATMNQAQRLELEMQRLTNSPFMNPQVFKAFLNMLELKEHSLVQEPEAQTAHRYVKLFVQNGLYTMFKLFDEKFIYILKMYNIFENVLNYLATTVSQHKLSPEEPLSSFNLQKVQASELHLAATHVDMSTGLFNSFELFVGSSASQAILMRHS